MGDLPDLTHVERGWVQSLEVRVEALESEVRRLVEQVHLKNTAGVYPPTLKPTSHSIYSAEAPPEPVRPQAQLPAMTPTPPTAPPSDAGVRARTLTELLGREALAGGSAQVEPAPPKPARVTPIKTPGLSLESFIGTRGLAVIGAVIVVIGLGMGLTYAAQQGWLRGIPDWARMGAGLLFGAALLLAGEYLRKKINDWASAGFFIAGIGCMYASAYAGYAFFVPRVLGDAPAFILLAAISAMGVVLSLRARLVTVACASLVLAYFVPLLMRDSNSSVLVMPIYLLVLLGTGLGMSVYVGGRFVLPGRIAWWGTALLGGMWVLQVAVKHRPDAFDLSVVLVFLALAWAMVQSAHVLIARRDPARESFIAGLSSFGIASWASALGASALYAFGAHRYFAPAGCGVGAAVLATVVMGSYRPMSEKPQTYGDKLCVSLWAQCGGLLIATVLLLTKGNNPVAVIIWLVMGLSALWAGRRLELRSMVIYGLLLMGIGTGRLIFYDLWASGLFASPIVVAPGLLLTAWTGLCALAAASWLGAAWVLRGGEPLPAANPWPTMRPLACTLIAAGLLLASVASRELTPAAMGWSAVLIGFAAAATALQVRGIWLHAAAGLAFVVAAYSWFAGYVPDLADGALRVSRGASADWSRSTATPLLHPGLQLAAGVVVLGVCGRLLLPRVRHLRDKGPSTIASVFFLGISALVLWVATSLEVARLTRLVIADTTAHGAAVSIWWALLGVAAIAVGFACRIPIVRHVGLGLLGLGAIKVVVIDLASVSTPWRIISFVTLGLLMLGVAAGYGRMTKVAKLARAPGEEPYQ